ncbi:MAG: hypothetical protein QOJ56_123, partial [Mycobacterium sp.]|nr:hypothetical protein [Mycobacterium sp.]
LFNRRGVSGDPDYRSNADRWSDGLRSADAEGRFFASYTGFLVSGTRLDGVGSEAE